MTTEGHDPLLSQEETDALLDAMRAGGEGQPEADAVDLTAPDRPLRAAMSHADQAAEAFVRAAPRCFLRTLGCSTTVEEEPCEIVPYSVLSSAVRPGSAVAIFSTEDGSVGFFVLGPTLVTYVLDRQMGAPLTADDGDGKPSSVDALSNLDRRVLRPVIERLLDTFSEHWSGDHAFRVGEVLARTSDLPRLPQFEPLLRVAMRVVPIGAPGDEILIAMTSQAVLATAPRAEAAGPSQTALDREQMSRRISTAEVDCVSVLGTTHTTIRDVLRLSEGDVVRLSSVPGRSVTLTVGDVVVALGMPVVHHGNLALEITKTR